MSIKGGIVLLCSIFVLGLAVCTRAPARAEDTDNQFVGYVSNEEDRFVGYVWGFIDEFHHKWPCTQYYWGQARFLKANRLSFADSADLCYIAGHGNASYIVMSAGQDVDLTNCPLGSYASADHNGDLEYIIFHSCKVLQMDTNWRSRWKNYGATEKKPFWGIHEALGFRTNHYNGAGAGRWAADEFGENLRDGYNVRWAWYEAVDDARWLAGWTDNKPAIFYVRPHENETVDQHNSTDYKYGDGNYLIDAYYMN